MSYAVSKLTTIVACEQAIASATERKSNLLFEQTVSEKAKTDQASIVNQTNASLISVLAEITGAEAAIAALPVGKDKEAYTSKLRRLNDRKENLEDRLKKSGAASLLESELETALINIQLTELDSFVTAVTARKATL
jgi:hypothetical protein